MVVRKRRKIRVVKEPKPKIKWEEVLAEKLVAAGFPNPRVEFVFHSKRKWRGDVCYPGVKLLIEIEGGAFTRGRHTRGAGFVADMEKYNAASLEGWTLLRFTPTQVKDGVAVAVASEMLEKLGVKR